MILVRNFVRKDLEEISLSEASASQLCLAHDLDKQVMFYEANARTFTFIDTDGENIICIAGIAPVARFTGELFMLTSPSLYSKRLSCIKSFKGLVQDAIRDFGLQRVQCSVSAKDSVAVRFIEWLGFERECIARKYMNGEDFYLYSCIDGRIKI